MTRYREQHSKNAMEIHTVTFSKDIRLLELQLISIDKLLDHDKVSKLRIIINDDNHIQIKEKIEKTIESDLSFSLAKKIEISSPDHFTQGNASGWRNQQHLKLLSVADSKTDWVMILDSKNHFTKRTNCSDFFIEGKAKTQFKSHSKSFHPWLHSSLTFFDICNEENMNKAMPTITPYLMKPELVRLMLGFIHSKSKIKHGDSIFKDPLISKASEFFLYYAFMRKLSCIDDYYVAAPLLCRSLYTTWPKDHNIVNEYLNEVISGELHMFGLHRNRLPQLTDEEKKKIKEIWHTLSLKKDPDYYLEHLT